MKKKLLAVVLSVVMLVALMVPMFAISADSTPTAKIGLSNIRKTTRIGVDGNPSDVIAIDINISDNTGYFFVGIYQLVSDNSLTPYSSKSGRNEVKGFDNGTFASSDASLAYTVTPNPTEITETGKTGFKVVMDSTVGTMGINTVSGYLGTAYFVAPTEPGTYTFRLLGLDVADDGYIDDNTQPVPRTYNITVDPATITYTVEADCSNGHVGGNGEWEHNETQHFHTCACGEIIDAENHKGGEATCKDKAVCSVCNTAYGELAPANHKGQTEVRGYVAASCNTPGYTGDTYCLDCNQKIEDGTPTNPTNEHVDANGKWETNGTQHFHTCACGEIIDAENHKGGEATCKDKAVCSVCNTAYGELAPANHKGQTEVRGYVAASCNTPGYTGDIYCRDCNQKIEDGTPIAPTNEHVDANGKWETNGTQHFHTCACGTEFDKQDHFGGEANCKDKAVCDVCEVAYGEIDADNHSFDGKITIIEEPTAEKEGKYTVECTNGCGNSDERKSKKLTNKVGSDDNYISSKENILPEDVDISINKGDEKDGKVEVEFTFDSNIVDNLEGDVEYVLDISEAKKEYTNFKAYKVNADGTRTLVSEIKGNQLVISANLKDTLVLTYEEIEDVKSPATSDSMNVTVFAVIALLAVAGLAVIGKKRFAL